MGKFFLNVLSNQTTYKLCKEDIKAAYSYKVKKLPNIPAYDHLEKNS